MWQASSPAPIEIRAELRKSMPVAFLWLPPRVRAGRGARAGAPRGCPAGPAGPDAARVAALARDAAADLRRGERHLERTHRVADPGRAALFLVPAYFPLLFPEGAHGLPGARAAPRVRPRDRGGRREVAVRVAAHGVRPRHLVRLEEQRTAETYTFGGRVRADFSDLRRDPLTAGAALGALRAPGNGVQRGSKNSARSPKACVHAFVGSSRGYEYPHWKRLPHLQLENYSPRLGNALLLAASLWNQGRREALLGGGLHQLGRVIEVPYFAAWDCRRAEALRTAARDVAVAFVGSLKHRPPHFVFRERLLVSAAARRPALANDTRLSLEFFAADDESRHVFARD
ncbi:unnamed protein product [Prorocentrum cordatum]|uniref:Uncharacterized protein n=1 Tax=Prorocentrum cordatum TaxID=2364126 RepID=A0ABN9VR03_9DINO|nr:unnamed protein product [Polarella glacialis]